MSLSPAGRRAKGHAFERTISSDFQELGFEAMTTRAKVGGNWCASDHGIDLCGTEPFLVQCKRFKDYAPISCIEEIQIPEAIRSYWGDSPPAVMLDAVPLLITKADNKPTMAVLPWEELKKLIRGNFRRSE